MTLLTAQSPEASGFYNLVSLLSPVRYSMTAFRNSLHLQVIVRCYKTNLCIVVFACGGRRRNRILTCLTYVRVSRLSLYESIMTYHSRLRINPWCQTCYLHSFLMEQKVQETYHASDQTTHLRNNTQLHPTFRYLRTGHRRVIWEG